MTNDSYSNNDKNYDDNNDTNEDKDHQYYQLNDHNKHEKAINDIELSTLIDNHNTNNNNKTDNNSNSNTSNNDTPVTLTVGDTSNIEISPTPLPKKQLSLLAACLYAVLFSQNVLFPFLPFMVQSFFPSYSTSELGYKAGWLGSAFPAGTIFSSYVWGKLADRHGRKICLLFGLMTTAVTIGAFGMSPTFEAAVILRLMSGALNGNNGIVKAMVAEVCDSSNMARGMSMIGLLGGLARLTAPAMGGYLAEPAQHIDFLSQYQFLIDYPYALPCFVGTLIATVIAIFIAFYLKETLVKAPPAKPVSDNNNSETVKSSITIWTLLRGPTGIPILLNAILGLLAITQTEVIPLWLIVRSDLGGFNSSATHIATLLMALGPFQMVHQIFLYPRLAKKFQYKQLCVYSSIIMGIMAVILPYSFYLTYIDNMLGWIGLFVCFILMVVARVTALTCVFVLLNNSSTTETRARANGLAQTCASVGQLIGPLFGAMLFAVTVNFAVWPLDFSFVWTLMALLCFWSAWLTSRLPESVNKKRVDDVQVINNNIVKDADNNHKDNTNNIIKDVPIDNNTNNIINTNNENNENLAFLTKAADSNSYIIEDEEKR